MKYIVIEIQTNANETVGNLVSSYDSRNEAEQKYHLILSAAAVSSLPSHAAVLLTNDGRCLEYRCYHHEIEEEEEEN